MHIGPNYDVADAGSKNAVGVNLNTDRDVCLRECSHIAENVPDIGDSGSTGLEFAHEFHALLGVKLTINVFGIDAELFHEIKHLGAAVYADNMYGDAEIFQCFANAAPARPRLCE